MSCIAGVINLDGAPVERALLERMTQTMKERAPDETAVWCSGSVGLGHALLRISPESTHEHQPCTLDGQVWITADAHVDGRADLIAKLRSAGEPVRNEAPDVELILHAYHAFDDSFLDHLIGDFAFALWDERGKKLVCARDHFGVKPFYYVMSGNAFLFASDIEALLAHPAVSTALDEEAIGDFLLLALYQDTRSSIYRDIRRLPEAHRIDLQGNEVRIREYWTLPETGSVRYRNDAEYLDHFEEVFKLAVIERLRTGNAALELSGGMDSTSIAAVAAEHAANSGCTLSAYTVTSNRFFAEDQEGYYAAMVASQLSIPLTLREVGEHHLFAGFGKTELRTAEPSPDPHLAFVYDDFARISGTGARVLLSGQGGDELFGDSSNPYYADLLRKGRLGEMFVEVLNHVRHTGTLRGMGLRNAFLRSMGRPRRPAKIPDWRPPFPDWLAPDFVARTRLKDRWELAWARMAQASGAHELLRRSWMSQIFSPYQVFRLPLVARHPFFDVLLVQFMLALPGFIKRDKSIMRNAMRGKLPDPVRARPKSPALGDKVVESLARNLVSTPLGSNLSLVDNAYIDRDRYMRALDQFRDGEGRHSGWSSIPIVTPVGLNYWLAQR